MRVIFNREGAKDAKKKKLKFGFGGSAVAFPLQPRAKRNRALPGGWILPIMCL
jgi:hypothetical protein